LDESASFRKKRGDGTVDWADKLVLPKKWSDKVKKNNWLINAFFLATAFLPLTLHSEDAVELLLKLSLTKMC